MVFLRGVCDFGFCGGGVACGLWVFGDGFGVGVFGCVFVVLLVCMAALMDWRMVCVHCVCFIVVSFYC